MNKKALKFNGPLTCSHESCTEFRKREPEFAKRLHDAGIIAHYTGHSGIFREEMWMLDGITPINRRDLEELIVRLKKLVP